MIFKNNYVRATLGVMALTILAGIAQANLEGLLWFFAFTVVSLGLFVTFILVIISIFSVIKDSKLPKNTVNQEGALKPNSQPGTTGYYKKRFIWSLIIAAPGALLWLSAAFTTRNGGGEAYIVFIPLYFVSCIAIFAALLYGIAYLSKKRS